MYTGSHVAITPTFARHKGDGTQSLMVSGELDIACVDTFRSNVYMLLHEVNTHPMPTPVVVDLSGVTFIDASTLAVLVAAKKSAAASGIELVLTAPSQVVQRLLAITSLDHLLSTSPSI